MLIVFNSEDATKIAVKRWNPWLEKFIRCLFVSYSYELVFKLKCNFIFLQKNTPACSCVDCEQSCPAPQPNPPHEGPFVIAGLDGYAFVMTLVFFIGSSLFILSLLFCPSRNAIGKYRVLNDNMIII